MKIFSQSIACALVAVANAALYHMADGRKMCNPGASYCEYHIDGGWDLPVPQPVSGSISDDEPTLCYMGRLPARGQIELMANINCWSKEVSSFRNGNGPTGFTGFFVEIRFGAGRPWESCHFVRNGSMIELKGNCFDAISNNDPNRHVVDVYTGDEYYY